MNRKIIFHMLGQILKLEAAIMVLPLVCSLIYREFDVAVVFLITIANALALGLALIFIIK